MSLAVRLHASLCSHMCREQGVCSLSTLNPAPTGVAIGAHGTRDDYAGKAGVAGTHMPLSPDTQGPDYIVFNCEKDSTCQLSRIPTDHAREWENERSVCRGGGCPGPLSHVAWSRRVDRSGRSPSPWAHVGTPLPRPTVTWARAWYIQGGGQDARAGGRGACV